jgi:hypothetical protein
MGHKVIADTPIYKDIFGVSNRAYIVDNGKYKIIAADMKFASKNDLENDLENEEEKLFDMFIYVLDEKDFPMILENLDIINPCIHFDRAKLKQNLLANKQELVTDLFIEHSLMPMMHWQ